MATRSAENPLQARLQQYIRLAAPPGVAFAIGLFALWLYVRQPLVLVCALIVAANAVGSAFSYRLAGRGDLRAAIAIQAAGMLAIALFVGEGGPAYFPFTALERLGEDWRHRGYSLALGVGITQGYATLGAIGFEERQDYAAIGTVTNQAARLCEEAQAGQILISERLRALVEPFVETRPVGELALRGFHRPVSAHDVLRRLG